MTFQPAKMYRSLRTQSQFLLSSSDTLEVAVDVRKIGPIVEIELDRDILKLGYPELKTDAAFVAASLEKLSDCDLFGTMVVKIDPSNDSVAAALCLEVAGAVNDICSGEAGWWGLIDPNLMACFFPGKNDWACQKKAQALRKSLWKITDATVSIGIASYPTAAFARDQVLPNACKALDHAGFFGPDSQVIFDDISLNISGDHLFQKGDIPAAMEEFASALLLEPANVNVRNSLGVCHSLLGNFDRALVEFETAVKLAPTEFMAPYNLGLVHVLMGNRPQALAHFLEAYRLRGDVFEVTLQAGRMYLEMGEFGQGVAYLEKALRLNPTALAHRLMGDCHAAMGRPEEAISAYKQAVKQNPNDAAALSALGLLYEDKGENPEITSLFCEKSVEISPLEGIYRHRLGELYLKQGRLEDALKAFQSAAELGHDSSRYIEEIQNRLAIAEDQGVEQPVPVQ
ncbi:MAG: tetratricopeptide repeat protein [Pseudomonadota bacterium]